MKPSLFCMRCRFICNALRFGREWRGGRGFVSFFFWRVFHLRSLCWLTPILSAHVNGGGCKWLGWWWWCHPQLSQVLAFVSCKFRAAHNREAICLIRPSFQPLRYIWDLHCQASSDVSWKNSHLASNMLFFYVDFIIRWWPCRLWTSGVSYAL